MDFTSSHNSVAYSTGDGNIGLLDIAWVVKNTLINYVIIEK